MSQKIAYKFLMDGLKSQYDGSPWSVGEWRHVAPPTSECVGLNASRLIQNALGYVQGTILAKVEYKGMMIDSGNKLTCESMRVVKTWPWTKRHSVRLALFAARDVLPIWTKRYPDDDRPAKAIAAAQAWLDGEGSAHAAHAAAYASHAAAYAADAAACAADAAYASHAAAYAADAAAYAADAAAYAADAAYAAYAADAAACAADAAYAAYAAHAAAYAAYASMERKCHRFVLRMLKEES